VDVTDILLHVASLIYFFLPAYAANMSPVLCKNIFKPIATPIDRGKTLFGRPVFGTHKTWRGIVVAALAGTVVFAIQAGLASHSLAQSLAIIDYTTMPIYFGTLLGFGAMLGDLCKSFLKRQVGIKPGHPWHVIDQIDYIVGAVLLTSPIFFPGWMNLAVLVLVSLVLSIIVNHAAYALKIRSVRW